MQAQFQQNPQNRGQPYIGASRGLGQSRGFQAKPSRHNTTRLSEVVNTSRLLSMVYHCEHKICSFSFLSEVLCLLYSNACIATVKLLFARSGICEMACIVKRIQVLVSQS